VRVAFAFAVSLSLIPSAAVADEAVPDHRFGEPGQYLLTSESRLDVRIASVSYQDHLGMVRTDDHVVFDAQIAVDKVMWPHVTAGLSIGFQSDVLGESALKAFSAGGRLGYIIDLGTSEDVSLWPRLGLTYANTTYQFEGGGQFTIQSVRLAASLPLVWRPVKRFFLGGGPMYEHDIYAAAGSDAPVDKDTIVSVHALLGGWFHGY